LQIDTIPTGSLALDIALGVGGIPRGRITEIYGPESSGKTTICQHVVAQAQKRGGMAAYIDMEHALDPSYAAKCGVDVDNLLISQPDTGEQAFDIAEQLIRSNAIDICVIDSVAALVPKAEIEGEITDMQPGIQARLMSKALRRLAGLIKQSNTTVLFTNQLRHKIGVMFGCFHYDARVVLADGSTEKIGKIVNQKMAVDVLSFNTKSKKLEPRRIVNWFNNGNAEQFLQFVVDGNNGNGRHSFACTPNHLLLSEKGWKHASELRVHDRLMTSVSHYLSETQREIVYGSLLGDGSFRRIGDYNTQLRIGHGQAQNEYLKWKASLFEGVIGYEGINSRNGISFDTIPMYELSRIVERDYQNGRKNPSDELIDSLSPLSLAIWYMDDGTFDQSYGHQRSTIACGDISEDRRFALAHKLTHWGIDVKVSHWARLEFNVEGTRKLHELIAPYVYPSMDYKLMPKFRGRFKPFSTQSGQRNEITPMSILEIYAKPKTRSMNRFDIEVEGNHAYLVDGVVVHNSPETTTGGMALKFYASVRLDVRRINAIKNGGDTVGNRTRVRVTKNKVAAPFRECEFDIMYAEGISEVGDMLDVATNMNIVEKRGTFFMFDGTRIGQGRENAKTYLQEHPEVAQKVEAKVRETISSGNAAKFAGKTKPEAGEDDGEDPDDE
jgi:recombination protein RecA